MKIVIINDMLWGGGKERRIVQLIKGLNDLGYYNIFLILLDERIDYNQIYDLKVQIIKILRRSNKDLSVFPKLFSILNQIKPDIINTWSFISTFYSAPISKILKTPLIGSFIADCNRPKFLSLNYFAMKVGFLFCNKIISNSSAGHLNYDTPRKKRIVIYNGFDEKRKIGNKSKEELFSEFSIDSKKFIVTMSGRFDKQKDFETFIKACQILRTLRNDFIVFCLGKGDLFLEMVNNLKEIDKQYIKFPGFRNDVESFINASDIGVLCTNPKYHQEGISNSILEFMAFSKPVIATYGGGTNEIIEAGKNGIIIQPFDTKDLSEKLNLLLESEQLRTVIGNEGRNTVSNKFSLPKMTEEFVKVFSQVIKSN